MKIMILLLMMPVLLMARVVEIGRLEEIRPEVGAETLVVFDIDNTLLQAEGFVGSVAWADGILEALEERGLSHKDREEIMSLVWQSVQPHVAVKAVDPDGAALVKALQEQNIRVICLTARMPEEAAYTCKQLEAVGLSFETILFATPVSKKSVTLLKFLEQEPGFERVLFVDDKLHHAEDVAEALEQKGLACLACHFRFM